MSQAVRIAEEVQTLHERATMLGYTFLYYTVSYVTELLNVSLRSNAATHNEGNQSDQITSKDINFRYVTLITIQHGLHHSVGTISSA